MKGIQLIIGLLFVLLMPALGKTEGTKLPSKEELLRLLSTETSTDALWLHALPVVSFQDFAPKKGESIGTVQYVQGKVLIIPHGGYDAYHLQKSLPVPIFNGDTIVTGKQSRITLLMKDQSTLTLTAQSKMVIDRSVYNPESKQRDTTLHLLLGRLRAVVAKITGENSYRVQTPTATAGVRGTDFALVVVPSQTALVTGDGDSTVKLSNRKGDSVIVGPLSIASSTTHSLFYKPERIGHKAVQILHKIAPELDSTAEKNENCWWFW